MVTNISYDSSVSGESAIGIQANSEAFVQISVTDQKTVVITNVSTSWDGVTLPIPNNGKELEYILQQGLEKGAQGRRRRYVVRNMS